MVGVFTNKWIDRDFQWPTHPVEQFGHFYQTGIPYKQTLTKRNQKIHAYSILVLYHMYIFTWMVDFDGNQLIGTHIRWSHGSYGENQRHIREESSWGANVTQPPDPFYFDPSQRTLPSWKMHLLKMYCPPLKPHMEPQKHGLFVVVDVFPFPTGLFQVPYQFSFFFSTLTQFSLTVGCHPTRFKVRCIDRSCQKK